MNVLPEIMETIIFGNSFNREIKVGILPKSLKSLTFGRSFNQL